MQHDWLTAHKHTSIVGSLLTSTPICSSLYGRTSIDMSEMQMPSVSTAEQA